LDDEMCCYKDFQYCHWNDGCTYFPSPKPYIGETQSMEARCWARDVSTGQFFCTGLDSLTLVEAKSTPWNPHNFHKRIDKKATCRPLFGFEFVDATIQAPPDPNDPPTAGYCPADFCSCCGSNRSSVILNRTNESTCNWSCKLPTVQEKSWCHKPSSESLGRCGERAYPHKFNPCETLCQAMVV
jgi:hypothetical protein